VGIRWLMYGIEEIGEVRRGGGVRRKNEQIKGGNI
jgi:hypothetical protein